MPSWLPSRPRPESFIPPNGAEAAVGLAFPPPERGPLIDTIQRERFTAHGEAVPVADTQTDALEFVACGRPLPGYEVRIVDQGGQELPQRREGRLEFRGPSATRGYLNNPAASAEAFKGGYFHSGDLAVCHPDGYVEIRDRAKDVIISGGENISSIEVEGTLYRHPAVLEAAVAAMPDAKWGEVPCAFVTLRAGDDAVSEQDIIDFCRDNMAHFKAPKKVVFGELPKTSTGKIQKFELRERAKQL